MCTRHGRCARAWVGGMAHTKMVGFLHPLEAGVSQHAILLYYHEHAQRCTVHYCNLRDCCSVYRVFRACVLGNDVVRLMLRFLVRCLAMSLLSSVLAN